MFSARKKIYTSSVCYTSLKVLVVLFCFFSAVTVYGYDAETSDIDSLTSILEGSAVETDSLTVGRSSSVNTYEKPTSVLEQVAKDRKVLMLELLEENPSQFVRSAIGKKVRDGLPAEVKKHIEEEVQMRGTVEALHDDDFDNVEDSSFEYMLAVKGKYYPLRTAEEDFSAISGAELQVNGYKIDSTLVAYADGGVEEVYAAPPPDSLGDQRMLVIPIKPAGSPSPISRLHLREHITNGPFQTFYTEQSYNKINFDVDVMDWVQLSDYPKEACQSAQLSDPLIKQAIAENGISFEMIDHVVFVSVNHTGGCAYVGKSEEVIDGVTYQLGKSWVGLPEWSYNVELTRDWGSGRSKTNTLTGIIQKMYQQCRTAAVNNPRAHVQCKFITSEEDLLFDSEKTKQENDIQAWHRFDFVLAHEVGHALGVFHANGWDCDGASYYRDCVHREYGNYFDAMGYGAYGLHFNAVYKDYFQWLDPLTVDHSGEFSLGTLETISGGVQALEIVNAVFDPSPGSVSSVFVEYREPLGFDDVSDSSAIAGLHVNQKIEGYNGAFNTRLMNATQQRDPENSHHILSYPTDKGGLNYPSHGIQLRNISIDHDHEVARFNVEVTDPVCKRGQMSLGVFQDEVVTSVDSGEVYSGHWVKNNDSPSCQPRELSMGSYVRPRKGFSINEVFNDGGNRVSGYAVLDPGEIGFFEKDISIESDVSPGSYEIVTKLTSVEDGRNFTVVTPLEITSQPVVNKIVPTGGLAGDEVQLRGMYLPEQYSRVFIYSLDGLYSTTVDDISVNNTGRRIVFDFPDRMLRISDETLVPTPPGQYKVELINHAYGDIAKVVTFDVSDELGLSDRIGRLHAKVYELQDYMLISVDSFKRSSGAALTWLSGMWR